MRWNELHLEKLIALKAAQEEKNYETFVQIGQQIVALAGPADFLGIVVPLLQLDIARAHERIGDLDMAKRCYDSARSRLTIMRDYGSQFPHSDDWPDEIERIGKAIRRVRMRMLHSPRPQVADFSETRSLMKKSKRFHLVIQYTENELSDIDSIYHLDRSIDGWLSRRSVLDAHDVGAGQVNYFISTDDPTREFENLIAQLPKKGLRVAFRKGREPGYKILWPDGATEPFTVK